MFIELLIGNTCLTASRWLKISPVDTSPRWTFHQTAFQSSMCYDWSWCSSVGVVGPCLGTHPAGPGTQVHSHRTSGNSLVPLYWWYLKYYTKCWGLIPCHTGWYWWKQNKLHHRGKSHLLWPVPCPAHLPRWFLWPSSHCNVDTRSRSIWDPAACRWGSQSELLMWCFCSSRKFCKTGKPSRNNLLYTI